MSWPRNWCRLPVSRSILMRMAELLMDRAAPRKMRSVCVQPSQWASS